MSRPDGRTSRLMVVGGDLAFAALARAFFGGLRQPGMRADPFNSIFLGSEFPDMALLAIRPQYPHAPNAALLHWR
jgi:hypothetical protein